MRAISRSFTLSRYSRSSAFSSGVGRQAVGHSIEASYYVVLGLMGQQVAQAHIEPHNGNGQRPMPLLVYGCVKRHPINPAAHGSTVYVGRPPFPQLADDVLIQVADVVGLPAGEHQADFEEYASAFFYYLSKGLYVVLLLHHYN